MICDLRLQYDLRFPTRGITESEIKATNSLLINHLKHSSCYCKRTFESKGSFSFC